MIDWRKVHPLGTVIFWWESEVTLCDVPRVLPLLARCEVLRVGVDDYVISRFFCG